MEDEMTEQQLYERDCDRHATIRLFVELQIQNRDGCGSVYPSVMQLAKIAHDTAEVRAVA
jgi:hypothetical protein